GNVRHAGIAPEVSDRLVARIDRVDLASIPRCFEVGEDAGTPGAGADGGPEYSDRSRLHERLQVELICHSGGSSRGGWTSALTYYIKAGVGFPVCSSQFLLSRRMPAKGTPLMAWAKGKETFAALSVRNFRLYFLGQIVSLSGTWM